MCGIAGILCGDRGQTIDPGVVTAMCRDLFHRGPDDWGVAIGMPHENAVAGTVPEKTRRFVSPAVVGLGNTRLSIIDLSDAGHQPMATEDERAWIVYNGEVYNFQELRTALVAKGHVFHSRTDTEVILRLFETAGPDCFRQLNGMFSVAIWDNHERALYLARDRFGVKPLYYVAGTDRFAFASEIKALLRTGSPIPTRFSKRSRRCPPGIGCA
jgi:asparagine synthase (glutamine-hydrolysing)